MRTVVSVLGLLLVWVLGVEVVLRLVLLGMGVHWPALGVSVAPHVPPLHTLKNTGPRFEDVFAHHPVLGWVNQPRAVVENGLQVTVGPEGFRAIGGPSPGSVPRTVVVVGDSFSFGSDLADADVYLTHVQAALPEVAVLDLGVPIYGPDQMWLSYREQGRAYHPQLVVMALLGVDLFRADHDLIAFPKPRFVMQEGGGLQLTGVPTLDRERTRLVSLFRPRVLDAVLLLERQARARWRRDDDPALARAIVGAFVEEVRADGAEVLVLGLPDGTVEDDAVAWFERVCEDREACVRVDPGFTEARAAGVEVLGPFHHWSETGSRMVAEAVLAAVGDRLRGAPADPGVP